MRPPQVLPSRQVDLWQQRSKRHVESTALGRDLRNGERPELQRHSMELAAKPAEWMPWNYRETLARLAV